MTIEPNWIWANGSGTSGTDYATSIGLDQEGFLYIAGKLGSNLATFRSVSNPDIIINGFTSSDAFVGKMDKNGNWLWVNNIGTSTTDNVVLTVDGPNNYIAVGGEFIGTCTFNSQSVSPITITAFGLQDIFVATLTRDGDFLNVYQAGSSGVDTCDAIYMQGGFIFVSGKIGGTEMFFRNNNFIQNSITAPGPDSLYLGLAFWISGGWDWVMNAYSNSGGSMQPAYMTNILDRLVLVGNYVGTTLTFLNSAVGLVEVSDNISGQGSFVARFENFGTPIEGAWNWVSIISGETRISSFGSVDSGTPKFYVSGVFQNTITFSSSSIISLSSKAINTNIFVAEIDYFGIWQTALRGSIDTSGFNNLRSRVLQTTTESLLLCGKFRGTLDIDNFNGGSYMITGPSSNYSHFVIKLNIDGDWEWSLNQQATSSNSVALRNLDILSDDAGSLFIASNFQSSDSTFRKGTTTQLTLTGGFGGADIFISRINEPTVQLFGMINTEDGLISLFINPNSGANCTNFPADDSHAGPIFGLSTLGEPFATFSLNFMNSDNIIYSVDPVSVIKNNSPGNYRFESLTSSTPNRCSVFPGIESSDARVDSVVLNFFDTDTGNDPLWNNVAVSFGTAMFTGVLVGNLTNTLCYPYLAVTITSQTNPLNIFSNFIDNINVIFDTSSTSLSFGASISNSFCCILPGAKVKVINSPDGYKFIEDLRRGDIVTNRKNEYVVIMNNACLMMNNNVKKEYIKIKKNAFGPEKPDNDLSITRDHPVIIPDSNQEILIQDLVDINSNINIEKDYLTRTFIPITNKRDFIFINNFEVCTFGKREFKAYVNKLKSEGHPIRYKLL